MSSTHRDYVMIKPTAFVKYLYGIKHSLKYFPKEVCIQEREPSQEIVGTKCLTQKEIFRQTVVKQVYLPSSPGVQM